MLTLQTKIKWVARHQYRENKVYRALVDGTDCKIVEPSPFSPKWFSHKFRSAGLRYEVGVGIGNGFIVWVFGPFPCGEFTDLKIFRLKMKRSLIAGEIVVTDEGYQDEKCSASSQNLDARI